MENGWVNEENRPWRYISLLNMKIFHPEKLPTRWSVSPQLRKQKGLQRFVYVNRWGGASIDYSDPKALEELTRSLLAEFYQITWRLPDGSLAHLGHQRHFFWFLWFLLRWLWGVESGIERMPVWDGRICRKMQLFLIFKFDPVGILGGTTSCRDKKKWCRCPAFFLFR